MGGATSPYRVLAERPPTEALRVLPVLDVRPLVLSEYATFDDEDFATVRYVADSDDVAQDGTVGSKNVPLWLYLVAGFTTAFGSAWAMFWGR